MQTEPELNSKQKQAVEHIGSPLLVLAGAGSGKTRVITHKIVHLILKYGIPSRNIAAITFTNKAAREMKQRIGRMLQTKKAADLTVSTFHSLGLRLLRNEYARLGYRSGFSILDPEDSEALLRELTHKNPQELDISQCHQRISYWKNALQSPEQALASADNDKEQTCAKIYARYQRQLLAYNAVDFDDLIMQPVNLLREQPEICEHWQNRFHHLLIDEYQDTNASQYTLMKLLLGINRGLTAVGDDDQSIYAWRGARPENIALLHNDFSNLRIIKLEQNYRSTNRILQSANHLISNNPHLFNKRLWSGQGLGDQLRIMTCKNPAHEAQRIASTILQLRFKLADRYSNYAILYRGNHQSHPIEKALREHHIPYKISGGNSFFEATEIKDIIAYLRLLANPEDDPAFLRIVNTPRRGIGTTTLERLGHHAAKRHTSLFFAAREIAMLGQLTASARIKIERFTNWVYETMQQAKVADSATLARAVVDKIQYRDWLLECCKNLKTARKRIENVDELLDWIMRQTSKQGESIRLEQLMAQLSLMDIIERNNDERVKDAVQLMTLHAAKGLEFSHVWIAGMEENLLPHHSHAETGLLEEERRLAYVGITRAQQHLSLSYATQRSRYGEPLDCEPSRFLQELPKEHVCWETGELNPRDPKAREAGKAHLSNLRAMLID